MTSPAAQRRGPDSRPRVASPACVGRRRRRVECRRLNGRERRSFHGRHATSTASPSSSPAAASPAARPCSQGGAGLAAGALAAAGLNAAAAQDATPARRRTRRREDRCSSSSSPSSPAASPPRTGAEGRYTLTLEQGLGQTIYFSDRPERVVGAAPTPAVPGRARLPGRQPAQRRPGGGDGGRADRGSPWSSCSTRPTTRRPTPPPTRWRCWRSGRSRWGWASPRRRPTWRRSATAFGAAHLFIDDCPN